MKTKEMYIVTHKGGHYFPLGAIVYKDITFPKTFYFDRYGTTQSLCDYQIRRIMCLPKNVKLL